MSDSKKIIKYSVEDIEAYTRQTFYLTFEEKIAIDRIVEKKGCKRSPLIRQILDEFLNTHYPGIFDEVAEEAKEQRIEFERETVKRSYLD